MRRSATGPSPITTKLKKIKIKNNPSTLVLDRYSLCQRTDFICTFGVRAARFFYFVCFFFYLIQVRMPISREQIMHNHYLYTNSDGDKPSTKNRVYTNGEGGGYACVICAIAYQGYGQKRHRKLSDGRAWIRGDRGQNKNRTLRTCQSTATGLYTTIHENMCTS